jgi:hypothetical protein
MTTFPSSPKLLKGGLILTDPETSAVKRIILLKYNPDTLARSLQIQAVTADRARGDRSEALRRKQPPIGTIRINAQNPKAIYRGTAK